MSRRRLVIVFVGSLAVLLAPMILFLLTSTQSASTSIRPPELGGLKVPDRVYEIPFDRPYDLICQFFGEKPTVFRNCKVLGFTGSGDKLSGTGGVGGAGFSSSYERYFERWLVLKLADGRVAYIPSTAVKYIEEAPARSE